MRRVRRAVAVGAPDKSLTPVAGMVAVAELVERLGLIERLEARIGSIKTRQRGFSAGASCWCGWPPRSWPGKLPGRTGLCCCRPAIGGEVRAFLGRERYERAAASEDARAGIRNGYCPTTIETTAGAVTVARPKLRGTTERFASQLFGTGATKTNALEALVIAGFVRGLSTRDIEATLVEALGDTQAAISKSAV